VQDDFVRDIIDFPAVTNSSGRCPLRGREQGMPPERLSVEIDKNNDL
jgi:hypothetical protein